MIRVLTYIATVATLIQNQVANAFFSPVSNFTFEYNVPSSNSVEVSFTAFNEEFKYRATLDEHVIVPQLKSTVHQNGYTYLSQHVVRGYRSKSSDHYAAFVITPDSSLHGLVIRNGETYEFAPKYHYSNHPQHNLTLKHIDGNIVAFKHSSIDWTGIKCGATDHLHQIKRFNQLARTTDADLESSPDIVQPTNGNNPSLSGPLPALWQSCYPGSNTLHKEFVGFAVDYGAYKLMGSSVSNVQSYLTSLLMNVNYVYANQLNLLLSLAATSIQTSPGNLAWNQNAPASACTDIGTTLNAFTAWRKSQSNISNMQVSTWHLLSGCWQPPGTVGMAWIGSLCDKQYSAGVSSLFPGNWVTVAHELGHNHGANHTWPADQPSLVGHVGGIMDYGNGIYPPTTNLVGIYQFHPIKCKPLVCNEVAAAMSGKCLSGCQPISKCFQASAAVCGNGILEPSETCDDGALTGTASSCCGTDCQPISGAQCIGGECCNTACQFYRASISCGTNKAGYCGPKGTCISSTCAYYGLPYCGINPATNCTMMCMVNGQCNTMAGWTDTGTGLPLNMKVLDGSVCRKDGKRRTCLAGVCN
jgi:hypothetical protein